MLEVERKKKTLATVQYSVLQSFAGEGEACVSCTKESLSVAPAL